MRFDDLEQELLKTEAAALYETLQDLAARHIVECDSTGKKWRLRV